MKILIYTDNHFCETYSIIRRHTAKYTERLDNQIDSVNWVEKLAVEKGCNTIICAGDFFDKSTLSDMELTALKEIRWADLPHIFLVGNHESSINGLKYNTAEALNRNGNRIISEPEIWKYDNDENEICFLPYITESSRKPVFEYFGKPLGKRLIISHNDLKGVRMGAIVSQAGFELQDLEEHSTLVINGHLHNGQKITDKIINLGNLTGKDFGEDATKYSHNVVIFDTDTFTYELVENPYAFHFYKFDTAEEFLKTKLKPRAAVTLKCDSSMVDTVRAMLTENKDIIASRLIITKTWTEEESTIDMSSFKVDHIAKFIDCAHEHYGTDPILDAELAEVCK